MLQAYWRQWCWEGPAHYGKRAGQNQERAKDKSVSVRADKLCELDQWPRPMYMHVKFQGDNPNSYWENLVNVQKRTFS